MKTKEELIAFEDWVIQTYKEGKLRSPVHLSGGNEKQLIEIFKEIKPQDWVFSTYRSHYHALLKGLPEQWLKEWILDNKSIHVMNKEHKFWTSAIVGGTIPIALGVAMGIKKNSVQVATVGVPSNMHKWKPNPNGIHLDIAPHVWCFIGDMTASLGIFNDCLTYAMNHDLPITFIIENNELSTDTPTAEVWGSTNKRMDSHFRNLQSKHVKYYKYKRTHPHYGTGEFVIFKDEKLKQDGKNF